MSNLRQRMRVVVDGVDYTVTTSARDVAVIEKYVEAGESDTMNGFRLAHAALLRIDADVPTDFDAFLDLIDDLQQVDAAPAQPTTDDEEPKIADPTPPTD